MIKLLNRHLRNRYFTTFVFVKDGNRCESGRTIGITHNMPNPLTSQSLANDIKQYLQEDLDLDDENNMIITSVAKI